MKLESRSRFPGTDSHGQGVELPLRSGTDSYLVHINIGRVLDRERDSARDGLRWHRGLVAGVGELGLHLTSVKELENAAGSVPSSYFGFAVEFLQVSTKLIPHRG
jgi:hypothetical protein